MNQESIKMPSSLPSPEKKEEEWKNVLSIIFLALFLPLGLILMWLLANWSRKTKVIITAVFVVIFIIIIIIWVGMIWTVIDGARERGRDASRVSGVRNLAIILEKETIMQGMGVEIEGCRAADAKTTTCIGPGEIGGDFPDIEDPIGNGICGASGVTGPCHYGISREDGSPGARTDDYQICFYLEAGGGGLDEGFNSVVTRGRMISGCN